MHSTRVPQVVQGEGVSQQASLLVSILIRYPELISVRFGPVDGHLLFSFLVARAMPENEVVRFSRVLQEHLEAYIGLTKRQSGAVLTARRIQHGEHTMIEIERDVATLSQQELSLLTALVRSEFSDELMVEAAEQLPVEESAWQEEMIEEMLADVRVLARRRELVGYREAGRVMVYNRQSADSPS